MKSGLSDQREAPAPSRFARGVLIVSPLPNPSPPLGGRG